MLTAIEVVQQFLRPRVSVLVTSKVPRHRPKVFIRVDQASPVRTNLVTDRTLVIIQVYATKVDECVDLIQQIREEMFGIDMLDNVFDWDEQAGPVEFPDPDTKNIIRWQFTGFLYHAV